MPRRSKFDQDATRYRGALERYFRSIERYRLLTPSGEHRLVEERENGHDSAWCALVEANLRLVIKIAREYRSAGPSLEDLISEGNIGLMKAARRFDPSRGVRFASYAAWWIRKQVVAAVHRHAALSSVPMVSASNSRESGVDRGRPSGHARQKSRQRVLSLEEFTATDERRSLSDVLLASSAIDADEMILEQELAEAIRAVLDRLPKQDRLILGAHFGLDDAPPITLQKIGRLLGITRERVRQLEARALERVRRMLLARKIGRR
jgi:RNA polymerase primary sigma factor